MKPLFISSLYHPNIVGGAEKVARIVAEGMLQQGHQPVVVTTHEGPADQVSHVNGVKVHYIALKNLYWPHARQERSAAAKAFWHGIDRYNPLMARAVARVLDAEKPDVVNTHNLTGFSCAVWKPVKLRRLPLVHTLHDYSLMCPKTSMFKGGENCQGRCTTCALYTSPSKRMSQRVDHVVGVSGYVLDRHLAAGYFEAAGQAHVIHNGVPGHPSAAPGPERPGRPLRLGYVGQLTPTKGIRELIGQMGGWQSGQCELLVAGKGAAAYEALLRAEAPKNVRFLGFVDPDQVYSAIDVLVVPSLWQEPLGMTVLEAYMHGVPVIVSRRGGLPEIVDEGRTGTVYEPLSADGLRQAVDLFLTGQLIARKMRPFVLEKARDFHFDRMKAKYLHLLAHANESPAIKEGSQYETVA
ncbi:MAG TPA: glycosyltransferase family 4 protein [Ramlibacter sp.]|nr:glycosyltransferase family 4 protein [Ramlibacter sp.]